MKKRKASVQKTTNAILKIVIVLRKKNIHTSNVGSQKDGGFDHGCSWVCSKGGEMVNVGGDTGQNSGCANQGMESSYQLRKVSDFNLLGDG